MRKPFLLGVHHDVDGALRPSRHGFRLVQARARKSEAAQQRLEGGRLVLVDGKFDERGAVAARARRQRGELLDGDAGALTQLIEQEHERALAVDRDAAGGTGAELVVEYFERQQTVEVSRLQSLHEIEERQLALSGEI